MLKLEEENIGKNPLSGITSMFTNSLSGLNTSDIVGTAGEKNIPYKQTVAQFNPTADSITAEAVTEGNKKTKEDANTLIALTNETNQLMKNFVAISTKQLGAIQAQTRAGYA